MSVDLTGKTAVVTGGSSGIGLATARLFLQAGANVAICGRDTDRLASAAAELDGGDRLLCRECDVLEQKEVAAFAKAVEARFGGTDMLVNNAGQGRVSTFETTDDAAWQAEFNLKLFSIIYPTRAFLPLLEKSGAGAVVSSNALLARQPEPHMVATSSARAAVLNLNRSLAVEFAPKGIRVNSILIGLIESGQWRRRYDAEAKDGESWDEWTRVLAKNKGIPLGRLGKPEEAAQAIFFLATPLSSYTTGTALDISGGLSRYV